MGNNTKMILFLLLIATVLGSPQFRNNILDISEKVPKNLIEESKNLGDGVNTGPTNSGPTQPPPPSAEDAVKSLNSLPVAPAGSMASYDREKFRHWSDLDNNGCDSRQDTLIRDGKNLSPARGCPVKSGQWIDPYGGETFTDPGALDIDHLIPLAAAWRQGANAWSDSKREQFANDPLNLLAASASLNRQKGDKLADAWKPPLKSYHCQYARRTIQVHEKYNLSASPSEKSALLNMLGTCS